MSEWKIGRRGTLGIAAALATPGAVQAQRQQHLRIAMTASDIPTTTGMPNNGAEGMRFVGYPVFEPLVDWDLLGPDDRRTGFRPGLATKWSVDDTRLKWTFELRRGVEFHDGSAFTADAVVWNFARLYDDKSPQFEVAASGIARARVPQVSRWEKIDDFTVAIWTKLPASFFPMLLAWIPMASPAQYEKVGRGWAAFSKAPAGTGPFRITRVVQQQSIELQRNASYWEPARRPKVDRVTLVPMPEANTRLAALRSGQVDWIEVPPPDGIPSLRQAKFQITTKIYVTPKPPTVSKKGARGGTAGPALSG